MFLQRSCFRFFFNNKRHLSLLQVSRSTVSSTEKPKIDLDGENDLDVDNYTIPVNDPNILRCVTDYEWHVYLSCITEDLPVNKN